MAVLFSEVSHLRLYVFENSPYQLAELTASDERVERFQGYID